MSQVPRAARQLLRDLQSAGLTHVRRVAPLPQATVAGNGGSPKSFAPQRPSEGGFASHRAAVSGRAAASAPLAPPNPRSVTNLEANHDPLPVRQEQLQQLAACVAECTRCPQLARTRTQTVFGVGNAEAKVMFIGEAPGADEDRLGEPFVGKAGQLLTKIIEACGWKRHEIYICNILRCRPPDNRTPTETEADNCREYLDKQIAIVDPDYIVCWGSCAAQNLLGTKDAIGKMRQRFYQHGRAKVLCTYHPSYLLRNPAAKKPVWDDMKYLLGEMGLTPPGG